MRKVLEKNRFRVSRVSRVSRAAFECKGVASNDNCCWKRHIVSHYTLRQQYMESRETQWQGCGRNIRKLVSCHRHGEKEMREKKTVQAETTSVNMWPKNFFPFAGIQRIYVFFAIVREIKVLFFSMDHCILKSPIFLCRIVTISKFRTTSLEFV